MQYLLRALGGPRDCSEMRPHILSTMSQKVDRGAAAELEEVLSVPDVPEADGSGAGWGHARGVDHPAQPGAADVPRGGSGARADGEGAPLLFFHPSDF